MPLLVDYACYNFETHLDAAAPTEKLRQALYDFNLSIFYRSAVELSKTESYGVDPSVTLEDIWYFIPTFFDCIQNCVVRRCLHPTTKLSMSNSNFSYILIRRVSTRNNWDRWTIF